MKTRVILATLVALFIFSINNLYASDSEYDRLQNESPTAYGKQIELIYTVKRTGTVHHKFVVKQDHTGNYLENIVYNWDPFKGWNESHKIDYSYNKDNLLVEITKSKWDGRKGEWIREGKALQYTYNDAGEVFLAGYYKRKR